MGERVTELEQKVIVIYSKRKKKMTYSSTLANTVTHWVKSNGKMH